MFFSHVFQCAQCRCENHHYWLAAFSVCVQCLFGAEQGSVSCATHLFRMRTHTCQGLWGNTPAVVFFSMCKRSLYSSFSKSQTAVSTSSCPDAVCVGAPHANCTQLRAAQVHCKAVRHGPGVRGVLPQRQWDTMVLSRGGFLPAEDTSVQEVRNLGSISLHALFLRADVYSLSITTLELLCPAPRDDDLKTALKLTPEWLQKLALVHLSAVRHVLRKKTIGTFDYLDGTVSRALAARFKGTPWRATIFGTVQDIHRLQCACQAVNEVANARPTLRQFQAWHALLSEHAVQEGIRTALPHERNPIKPEMDLVLGMSSTQLERRPGRAGLDLKEESICAVFAIQVTPTGAPEGAHKASRSRTG